MAVDVQALIEAAQERADSLSAAAAAAARNAPHSAAVKGSVYNAPGAVLRGAPPVYTGNVDITTDILRTFQDGFAQFKPEMLEGLADYIARFYPECVFATTENWICNTILYGGTGIPADIEAAIYQRARSRESQESAKLRDAAVLQIANRGFSVPPGVLAARLLEVEQDASEKSSAFNRDIAIKQAEIEIENIKFAVTEGVKIRVSVLSAIADYLKAYMMPIDLANDRADTMSKAKGVLLSSSADYYRAMISEAELALKAQEITGSSQTALEVAYLNALQRATESNSDASVSVANSLTSAAAASASAAITLGASSEVVIKES